MNLITDPYEKPFAEPLETDADGNMRARHPGDMHEPKPYPTESLHFCDDSYDHLHPYVD